MASGVADVMQSSISMMNLHISTVDVSMDVDEMLSYFFGDEN